jgi:hypothetical protein
VRRARGRRIEYPNALASKAVFFNRQDAKKAKMVVWLPDRIMP